MEARRGHWTSPGAGVTGSCTYREMHVEASVAALVPNMKTWVTHRLQKWQKFWMMIHRLWGYGYGRELTVP